MHQHRTRNGWPDCTVAPEVTVMAASGLWQDLREGLGQAELICSEVLGKRMAAVWCGRRGRQVASLDLAALPGLGPRRGGEEQ